MKKMFGLTANLHFYGVPGQNDILVFTFLLISANDAYILKVSLRCFSVAPLEHWLCKRELQHGCRFDRTTGL